MRQGRRALPHANVPSDIHVEAARAALTRSRADMIMYDQSVGTGGTPQALRVKSVRGWGKFTRRCAHVLPLLVRFGYPSLLVLILDAEIMKAEQHCSMLPQRVTLQWHELY